MADPAWPAPEARRLLRTRVPRLDAAAKVTGAAKYSFDVNRPGMLFARLLRCPHARARLAKLDVAPALRVRGVKAARALQDVGAELQWAMDEIAIVVATSEGAAADGVRAILVGYDVFSHVLEAEDFELARKVKAVEVVREGDPEGALTTAEVRVEGTYGSPRVAHCALEPHGQVSEFDAEGRLTAWCSTQAVTAVAFQLAEALELPATGVRVLAPHVGGGFGAKFSPDRWGVECAKLARELKAPVKLFLGREAELTVGGDRPSSWARVSASASKDGALTGWQSHSWGTGGPGGSGSPPLPYVLAIPNRVHQHSSIPTHTASARAWRAPNHPQACLITMAVVEDLAAKLAMDPIEMLRRNLALTGKREATYEEQLRIASDLSGWKDKWRPRGTATGVLRRGLGVSLHQWGGRGHQSKSQVSVFPDGAVEVKLSTQDIGTGTRTVVAMVLAETFGLPLASVRVSLGDSDLPPSGGSGGSGTVGGVSASTRRAAEAALAMVFEKVAPSLETTADALEAVDGRIRVKGDATRSLEWARAAAKIGMSPLTALGENPGPGALTDAGVGGVQVAEVEVDVETGVVRVVKMVAVQDCGLIVNLTTAESQVLGGLIMGISTALYEEKLFDPLSGRMLNGDMEAYKLAGLGDVGELVVHLMTGPGHDERGVIGLGEPPVISPAAALSNAVANAIGVRVPKIPLTPDRVLRALGVA